MEIRAKMVSYMKEMEAEVEKKANRLEEVGFEGYS